MAARSSSRSTTALMNPPGPKGRLLIVCSSLAYSAGLNSITIRLGASSACLRERSIGSWRKLWSSAKAPHDLAIRTRAEDLARHISADRGDAPEPSRVVRERPRIRQHWFLARLDGLLDALRRFVDAIASQEWRHGLNLGHCRPSR
jgi:hypothetical protein